MEGRFGQVQLCRLENKGLKFSRNKIVSKLNKNNIRIELKSNKPGFQPLVVVSTFSIVLASKDAVKKMIERQIKYTVFMMELHRAYLDCANLYFEMDSLSY